MSNIDKRNLLDEEPFDYEVHKDKKVHLYWEGKMVKIIKDAEAKKFLARMANAADMKEQQLIMAKLTGNFKRGNEKAAKQGK